MTIKELSSICNTSEQSLRGWCRRNGVPIAKTGASRSGYIITPDIEAAILKYYLGKQDEKEIKEEKQPEKKEEKLCRDDNDKGIGDSADSCVEKDAKEEQEQQRKEKNDEKEEFIAFLQSEISNKQRQIDELTRLLVQTQESLSMAQKLVDNQQRLHLLAVSEKNELEQKLLKAETGAAENQPKIRAWKRLFKRAKDD